MRRNYVTSEDTQKERIISLWLIDSIDWNCRKSNRNLVSTASKFKNLNCSGNCNGMKHPFPPPTSTIIAHICPLHTSQQNTQTPRTLCYSVKCVWDAMVAWCGAPAGWTLATLLLQTLLMVLVTLHPHKLCLSLIWWSIPEGRGWQSAHSSLLISVMLAMSKRPSPPPLGYYPFLKIYQSMQLVYTSGI